MIRLAMLMCLQFFCICTHINSYRTYKYSINIYKQYKSGNFFKPGLGAFVMLCCRSVMYSNQAVPKGCICW